MYGDAMGRSLLYLLLLMTLLPACKKEPPPPVVPIDPPTAPVAARPPEKVKPVVIVSADIAPFIEHFPAVNAITEDYNGRMDRKEKGGGALKAEGQTEIERYLKGKGLKPLEFMRKAAKIIRGWMSLKLSGSALPGDRELADIYRRALSAEERLVIQEHFDELSAVLKDMPVGR